MHKNRVKIIFQICFIFAYIIRRLLRHTNKAASIEEIMETSNAYNFLYIQFAPNWFDRQIPSFKVH